MSSDEDYVDEWDDPNSSFCISTSTLHRVLYLQLQWKVATVAIAHVQTVLDNADIRPYRADYSVNPLRPKIERLEFAMEGHASLLRNLCGFYPDEWEEFCQAVCPVIIERSRRSREGKMQPGRPTKLSPQERLLSCVLFLKGETPCRTEALSWNASKTSLSDDISFICEAIEDALFEQEIRWPTAEERVALGAELAPEHQGCIGYVDGTLCKIRRPHIEEHTRYYNKRKEMYCMNTVVIVDHHGIIIYVDAGFAGSFHDIRCLRNSRIYQNWREFFTVADADELGEYILGDPGYLGAEMFVMRRVDNREIANVQDNAVIAAYNSRHAAQRVRVEWGIGGIKNKFRRFLGCCPNRRRYFRTMFNAAAIMTNFIHRRRMDMNMEVVGNIPEQEMQGMNEFGLNWGV